MRKVEEWVITDFSGVNPLYGKTNENSRFFKLKKERNIRKKLGYYNLT